MKLDVIKWTNLWLGISGALVLASLVAFAVLGLKLGIDFTGGSLLEIEMPERPAVTEIRDTLSEMGMNATVQESGEHGVILRFEDVSEDTYERVTTALHESYGEFDEDRFESIGPVIGEELKQKSEGAVILLLVLIVLYVAWAFRHVSKPVASWKYGVLTIIAAMHDIIIPIGVFAVLGTYFGYEVNTAFIAALLTILGYSINDTIVVFDRTRENLILDRHSDDTFAQTVNKSVRESFARSINTSLTTLLVLGAIYFFGGETTQDFVLALMIGITAGAYSSIFIASPLLVLWEKWSNK